MTSARHRIVTRSVFGIHLGLLSCPICICISIPTCVICPCAQSHLHPPIISMPILTTNPITNRTCTSHIFRLRGAILLIPFCMSRAHLYDHKHSSSALARPYIKLHRSALMLDPASCKSSGNGLRKRHRHQTGAIVKAQNFEQMRPTNESHREPIIQLKGRASH